MRTHRFVILLGAVAIVSAFAFVALVPDASMASDASVHTFVAELAALATLREKRAGLVAEMRSLIEAAEKEDRDLTAEEQTKFDGLKAEHDALKGRIERMETLEGDAAALGNVSRPAAARRQGPTRAPGPEASREFESLGEFMHAVRFNPNDQRLNFVESAGEAGDDVRSELRMDNDVSGGFMVPPQLRTTIMKIDPQDALIRPRATVIPAGSPPDASITMGALDQTGNNPGNMFGGVEVKWIGEGEEKPETDAKLRQITLEPHEVAGTVTITDKLLRNWQASGAFIESLLRGAVAAAEDYAFMRGSGAHQPLGVINAGAVKWVNRAGANAVSYTDLVSMVARLLMRGGVSPVWSMPQSALPQIAKLKDENNNLIWHADAKLGFAGTLLGYPVRWNNRAPALGSKGDVILADWSYYLIKDGSGPFVDASHHVKFTSNKTVIKIFYNVDGAPWLTAPIKEENGYEVSPFVGLDVPA